MKATRHQQQVLLDLAALDLVIARSNRQLAELNNDPASLAKQNELLAVSESLIAARNAHDEIAIEISRLEQDLHLVEERIAKDKSRIDNSSNSKDIQATQHELVLLAKRKSTLEDVELEAIERREVAASEVAAITDARSKVQAELDQIQQATEAQLQKTKSALALHQDQRARFIADLEPEHIELYSKLLGKTLPVARLEGFNCGACGLGLSGASVDEIRNTPIDTLARCPECAAMLVRI